MSEGLTWEGIGVILANIVAVVSLVWVIVSFFKTQKNIKQQLNVNYITDKRAEWIKEVRQEVSEFISVARPLYCNEIYIGSEGEEEFRDFIEQKKIDFQSNLELRQSITEHILHLKLLMNFQGDIDVVIIKHIEKIQEDIEALRFSNIDFDLDALVDLIQIYLKLEWNRIKFEVNSEYTDELRKKDITQLCSAMEEKINKQYVNKIRKDVLNELKQSIEDQNKGF